MQVGSDQCNRLLVKAVCDILSQVKEESDSRYQLFELQEVKASATDTDSAAPDTNLTNGALNEDSKDDLQLIESSISLRQNLSPDEFHSQLRYVHKLLCS